MIASWGRWPPGSNEPALDPRELGEGEVNEIADCAAENGDRWDGKHGKAVRVQTQRTEQAEDGDVDEVDAERRAGEALHRLMQPLRLRAEGEQPGGHQARAGREALQKRRFQLPSFRREQPRPRKAEQKACGKQQPGAARGERTAAERIAQHRAADGAPHHGKRPLADDPTEVLQQAELPKCGQQDAEREPEGEEIAHSFRIGMCGEGARERERGIDKQDDRQVIEMPLVLPEQPVAHCAAQRGGVRLPGGEQANGFVDRGPEEQREQHVRDVPPPDVPRGDRALRVQQQCAAAQQEQRHCPTRDAAPEEAGEPADAADRAAA